MNFRRKKPRLKTRSRNGRFDDHHAPAWFDRLLFLRPARHKSKAVVDDIVKGRADADESVMPHIHRSGRGPWT